MKRRTSLIFIGCAAVVCGTFFMTGSTGEEETKGNSPRVVPTSGAPPRVHTPTGKVVLDWGETFIRSAHRPLNLILVDQVITIPSPPPPAVTTTTTTAPPPPPPPPTTTTTTAPPVVSTSNDGGWQQVAICEEGGGNDATYGYFGIMPSSWAAAGGTAYSATAGGSSWDTQVMIGDRINGGGPPWAPAGCAAAGYHGW